MLLAILLYLQAYLQTMTHTILYLCIFINIITYILYALDKWKAKQQRQRISERTLLTCAFLGGSPAALFAIYTLRHKSAKKSFLLKFWLLVIVQIGIVYYAYHTNVLL